MKAYNAKITAKNIQNYFVQSGLTMEAFANLLDISKRWLEYVFSEKENYEFDPNTVQKACDFFVADFRKFTTEIQAVPTDLRETLQKKHIKNLEFSKLLNDEPSLPFIIDNILVNDDEFARTAGIESKDIKEIIRKYYPKIELSNLSKTLQKSEYIHYQPHPTKKRTNVYKVK
jgi:transcriptional regulator with XRE-family HTH domain